jgi:CheY-like chemotaxis protein
MASSSFMAERGIQAFGFCQPAAGPWRFALADKSERTPGGESGQNSVSHSPDKRIQRPTSKPNLLLVEDNAADAMLVKEAIQVHEVIVHLHVVVDGEEAIAFIERAERDPRAPCPDMVLLDLNLPKRSGSDVLQRIRRSERCKHVPIVILTSSDSPRDRSEASRLGATRYFRKPTDYDEYMKVGKVLNEVLGELE